MVELSQYYRNNSLHGISVQSAVSRKSCCVEDYAKYGILFVIH